jgi:hypothetical protein
MRTKSHLLRKIPTCSIASDLLTEVPQGLFSALIWPFLINDVNRVIVLDGDDHGFENVHIPAVRDAQPDYFIRFRHQAPAQWNPQIAGYHPKYHWLPHPNCVSAFHAVPPELEV